ncbi:hypothetical protein QCD71_20590 [Sphingomonas sp. PsM26]|jgi:hypothetical protein|nr:hypothetical protein [Sphingomonas sp. PsM26]
MNNIPSYANNEEQRSASNSGNQERDPRQDAGQDASIARRLERDPSDEQAKLDVAIDESMDASDAPSITQPGRNDPAPSSGFNEEDEQAYNNKRK